MSQEKIYRVLLISFWYSTCFLSKIFIKCC